MILAIVGGIAITSFNSVKKEWSDYLEIVQTKQGHLMEIHSQMGYGGAIHIFKNYVLRGQQKYYEWYEKKADAIIAKINAYRGVGNLTSMDG